MSNTTEKVTPLPMRAGWPVLQSLAAETEKTYGAAAEVIPLFTDKQRPPVVEMAVERMLANVEEISNWLAGEGVDRIRVSSEIESRRPERLAAAHTATVLHAALVAADRKDAEGCLVALSLLVRRYLEQHDDLLQAEISELDAGGAA